MTLTGWGISSPRHAAAHLRHWGSRRLGSRHHHRCCQRRSHHGPWVLGGQGLVLMGTQVHREAEGLEPTTPNHPSLPKKPRHQPTPSLPPRPRPPRPFPPPRLKSARRVAKETLMGLPENSLPAGRREKARLKKKKSVTWSNFGPVH